MPVGMSSKFHTHAQSCSYGHWTSKQSNNAARIETRRHAVRALLQTQTRQKRFMITEIWADIDINLRFACPMPKSRQERVVCDSMFDNLGASNIFMARKRKSFMVIELLVACRMASPKQNLRSRKTSRQCHHQHRDTQKAFERQQRTRLVSRTLGEMKFYMKNMISDFVMDESRTIAPAKWTNFWIMKIVAPEKQKKSTLFSIGV